MGKNKQFNDYFLKIYYIERYVIIFSEYFNRLLYEEN